MTGKAKAPRCKARVVLPIARGYPVRIAECMNPTTHPSGRCWRHR